MELSVYEHYSESDILWVGQYPSHWDLTRVKYEAYVKARVGWHGLKSDDFTDEGPYLVTGSDFKGPRIRWSDCYHCDLKRYEQDHYIQLTNGDLLITKDGTIGKVALVDGLGDDEKATLNSGVFVVRPLRDNFLTKFYFWLLQSRVFTDFVNYNKTGSTIVHLYQDTFVNFAYASPDITEQTQIANFLDHETAKIDTLIEKQQQLIKLLKEKRQAVISHAVTKGLNPQAPMKDSGVDWLGEVPEHWVVAQLKFNTKLMQTGPFGSQLHAEDYVEGGVPLINPAHMINGEIVPDPQVSVDADTQERLSRHKLSEGDIIFARRGELGRCAVVTDQQVGWICGTGSLKATLNERLIPEYAYLLITSDGVVAELSLESKGSTMDNLNTETLGKIRTPVPPVHEQRAILAYVDEVSGKYKQLVDMAENAIGLMKERRTALISAAVTGKIDVRSWQAPTSKVQALEQTA
ncbi:restriction endonuclease subunit S [Vibrio harveyi]|nr:restriction endonuclease subunit S [Vibrio harveyi]